MEISCFIMFLLVNTFSIFFASTRIPKLSENVLYYLFQLLEDLMSFVFLKTQFGRPYCGYILNARSSFTFIDIHIQSLENKKGVQHDEENFCFGKIRHKRRFIGCFATNNVYSSSQTSFGSNGNICTISL